jgi:hypothetical protein
VANFRDEVWALVIDSNAGTRVRVFATEARARNYLAAYARDRWPFTGNHDRTPPNVFDALPDGDAIVLYFDDAGVDEWFVLEPVTVED